MIMVMHGDNLDKLSVDGEGTQKASHLHYAEFVHRKDSKGVSETSSYTFY